MNPDSILIVEKNGTIRFVNPATERLFGLDRKQLLGKQFKYSIPKENVTTKVDIVKEGGKVLTAQMQVEETQWENDPAYLLTLRDISQSKQFEKWLMESDTNYRYLFENSLYPIIIMTSNGIILDCNSSFISSLGFKKEEMINQKFQDSLPINKEDIPLFIKKCNSLLKNEISEPLTIKIRNKRGQLLWFNLYLSLIGFNGEVLIHILMQDCTQFKHSEQRVKELSQTLHEMNALIEHAPLAIFLLHQSGKVLRANEAAEILFGYPIEELLNFKVEELFDDSSILLLKRHYQSDIYNLLFPNTVEVIAKSKTNEVINVEITSAVLKISNNIVIQSFISNITERKNFELKRQLLLDQLMTSLEFKTKFLATMSHELRTPLNAILGFSQLLVDDSYGKLNDEQKDFIEDITSAGTHLLSLINSILDISKIEAGKFELNLEKVDVREIFKEINTIVLPLYSKKGLRFNFECISSGNEMIVDHVRLKQIIFNLVSNAIKFTEKGEISLKGIEKEQEWEFQVNDTGIGINEQDYDTIFKEFGRIENEITRDIPGTGLGLALTKRLVNLHGGKIWFESEFGKGTIFYFRIPKNSSVSKINSKQETN